MNFLHHDLQYWIQLIGMIGVLAILFCETGLFIGFFLPGDSLLFISGVLAAKHYLSMPILVFGGMACVIAGYELNYWCGRYFGHWLRRRHDRWYFKQSYLQRAHEFYVEHGIKSLIIGRFLPIVRTFIPIAAGAAKMDRKPFIAANIIGAICWVPGISSLGYLLGSRFENIGHLIGPIVIVIVILSVLPTIIYAYLKKHRKKS